MRTKALSNRRRPGEKRAIRRTDKGKGAGFRGPAKAFVSDVPAYHHLGIWSRCSRFGGLCRYRHGSAPRSEDAGCLDSAMVSAASPRSRCRRLQSPQARALRPPAVGWGLGTPGVLSRPWWLPGDSSPAAAFPAGHDPWTEAPRGVWGLRHVLATSCSKKDLCQPDSASNRAPRSPGPIDSLPQDFPGSASLHDLTPPPSPLALWLVSEFQDCTEGLAIQLYRF